MTEHYALRREHFQQIRNQQDWQRTLREFEIKSTFNGFAENAFTHGLELGCGSGENARFLAFYCKHLTATEYDRGKLTACDTSKITYAVADAQDLSEFHDDSMDLIYSGNLLEHLRNVDSCLAECRRIIKPGGTIVHAVPNNVWKVFHLLLFYPALPKEALRRIRALRESVDCEAGPVIDRLDDNLKSRPSSRLPFKKLFPRVHGISQTHVGEFLRWRESRWQAVFARNELDVVRRIRLPFYVGHGYHFPGILRLGNHLGLSASTAYILKSAETG